MNAPMILPDFSGVAEAIMNHIEPLKDQEASFDFCGSAPFHNKIQAWELLKLIIAEIFANDCLEVSITSKRADGWSNARNYEIKINICNPCA